MSDLGFSARNCHGRVSFRESESAFRGRSLCDPGGGVSDLGATSADPGANVPWPGATGSERAGAGSRKIGIVRRILLSAVLLVHLSCTSDNHAEWWIGDVAADFPDCYAVTGKHAVLDLKEFSSVPLIPFAWGGYRLFVQTEPPLLTPGSTLSLPSPQATALLCSLKHGAVDGPTAMSGTVSILETRGADLRVKFDLRSGDRKWELSGERWFERQGAPTRRP